MPKALVPVCGTPFLQYQLEWLERYGLTDIVMCVGHLSGSIEKFAKDGRGFGVNIRYAREKIKLLGTAGAIKNAENLLEDRFCVLNGDSYLPINPLEPIERFKSENAMAMMLTLWNQGQFDQSNAIVEDGLVTFYSRREKRPGVEFIDYGMQLFDKEVLELIPPGEFYDMDGVYQQLIERGQLVAHLVTDPFYEIGTAKGLARFSEYVQQTELGGQ